MSDKLGRECRLMVDVACLDRPLILPEDPQTLDWQFLVRGFDTNRTAGLAFWRLKDLSDTPLPSQALAALDHQYQANFFGNTILLQEAERILGALQGGGVEAIALKGLTLVEEIYPDIGTRKMADLDLLVRPEQASRATVLLEGLGYQGEAPLDLSKGVHNLDLKRGRQGVKVDLSWRFSTRVGAEFGRLPDVKTLVDRSAPLRVGESTALGLDRIDQIIYIATHAVVNHDNQFFVGLVDIYLLLSRGDPVPWEALAGRASGYGLLRPVTVALGVVQDLFRLPVGDPFDRHWPRLRRAIVRTPAMAFLDRRWILGIPEGTPFRTKRGGTRRNLARFYWKLILRPTLRDQMRTILGRFVPSRGRVRKTLRFRHPALVSLAWVLYPLLHLGSLFLVCTLGPVYTVYLAWRLRSRVVRGGGPPGPREGRGSKVDGG